MRGGADIFKQIEILDASGKPIEAPWLCDEIWGEEDQCLILYIHPGRIKWGVLLRELLGPVLIPDREYTLVLRGDMIAANGRRLGKDVSKKFRTTAEDRTRINLADWKLEPPVAGTKAPLKVHFNKSLDQKSLLRFLSVCDENSKAIKGTITIGPAEKGWS